MTSSPKTAAEWRETLAGLEERRETAESRAAEIDEGRGALVLAATTGDGAAKTKLAKLDERLDAVQRDVRDLKRAASEAAAELGAAEQREAETRRLDELREAEQLEREALVLAEEIDRDIVRVSGDVAKLSEFLSKAGRLRGSYSSSSVATRVAYAVRGAYWASDLKVGDYVGNAHRQTLVEGLAAHLGFGRSGDDAEARAEAKAEADRSWQRAADAALVARRQAEASAR